jgi:hypothetical protein
MEASQKDYTRLEITNARQSSSIGLIIRQKKPKNLETPFDQLDSFLTPTDLFYIRSHFPAPKLDLASYQLHIGRNPLSLSYKELRDAVRDAGRVRSPANAANSPIFPENAEN